MFCNLSGNDKYESRIQGRGKGHHCYHNCILECVLELLEERDFSLLLHCSDVCSQYCKVTAKIWREDNVLWFYWWSKHLNAAYRWPQDLTCSATIWFMPVVPIKVISFVHAQKSLSIINYVVNLCRRGKMKECNFSNSVAGIQGLTNTS